VTTCSAVLSVVASSCNWVASVFIFLGAVDRRHRWRLGNNTTPVSRGQPLRILHAPGDTSNAASGLHRVKPLPLFGPEPAGCGLDLDAGEYCHLLPDHVRRDRARGPADQVGAALAQAEAHRTAIGVTQRAGVIAE